MKKILAIVISLWTSTSVAQGLSEETILFSMDDTDIKTASQCDVLYERIHGIRNDNFKLKALVNASIKGSKKGLTSQQLKEYDIGYLTNLQYWLGKTDGLYLLHDDPRDIAIGVYEKFECTKYE